MSASLEVETLCSKVFHAKDSSNLEYHIKIQFICHVYDAFLRSLFLSSLHDRILTTLVFKVNCNAHRLVKASYVTYCYE